jgi:hypothetical protein
VHWEIWREWVENPHKTTRRGRRYPRRGQLFRISHTIGRHVNSTRPRRRDAGARGGYRRRPAGRSH